MGMSAVQVRGPIPTTELHRLASVVPILLGLVIAVLAKTRHVPRRQILSSHSRTPLILVVPFECGSKFALLDIDINSGTAYVSLSQYPLNQ